MCTIRIPRSTGVNNKKTKVYRLVQKRPRFTDVYNKKTKVYKCIHSEDRCLQMCTIKRQRFKEVFSERITVEVVRSVEKGYTHISSSALEQHMFEIMSVRTEFTHTDRHSTFAQKTDVGTITRKKNSVQKVKHNSSTCSL